MAVFGMVVKAFLMEKHAHLPLHYQNRCYHLDVKLLHRLLCTINFAFQFVYRYNALSLFVLKPCFLRLHLFGLQLKIAFDT